MLTKKQVAEKIGVSLYMVDKLTRKGDLAWYDFYGLRRYKEEDVDACLLKLRRIKKVEIFPGVEYVPGMKLV